MNYWKGDATVDVICRQLHIIASLDCVNQGATAALEQDSANDVGEVGGGWLVVQSNTN